MIDPARARKLLASQLAALIEEDRLAEDERKPVTLDQEAVGRLSRMDAMQVQAMAEAQSRRRAALRSRIHAALERIDEGELGYCLDCGEEIAEKRLEHDPSVTQCIKCAS